ncbi:MAG: SGNH/GDSL hydrolase family protein, partial [Verrucomicrobiae bacterium]|nr:SGNH/GDSL hydrolase family protein [Verrucomicrobiae bacterium]
FPVAMPKVEPQDGDTFVFLGDSITHQCLYTQYVEDYFYTRFPDRRLRFHNAGVSGDRAADALRRFDRDVASFRPNYVSILLGMNDGSYTWFKQDVFDTYQRDMTMLLDQLAGTGAKIAPMHPTMFDARAARLAGKGDKEPNTSLYNGVLAFYGAWLYETANRRGLGFVDMYSPLNQITLEQRQTDPKFTLIRDAVHPGQDGQVVMAVAMLNDLFVRGPMGSIAVTLGAGGNPAASSVNGAVSELSGEGGTIRFTHLAKALPWVLPEDARLGYKLTKAGHKFSQERFTAVGLAPGKYELAIDGTVVGSWTHAQLARGVELEENEKTPQYQQALAVAKANADRNSQIVKKLRDWWLQLKIRNYQLAGWKAQNPNAPAADTEAKEVEFAAWQKEFDVAVPDLEKQAQAAADAIYQINQPKPHAYELRPAPKPAAAP